MTGPHCHISRTIRGMYALSSNRTRASSHRPPAITPTAYPMATSTGQEQNRYKYSGTRSFSEPFERMRENESEARRSLNFHDFEARMLFNDRAMFNRPDHKAQDYPYLNPYSYCAGNPIRYINPTGEDIWRINGKGEVVEHTVTQESDRFEFVDKDKIRSGRHL